MRSINMTSIKIIAFGLLALLATLPSVYAQHPQQQPQRSDSDQRGGGVPAAPISSRSDPAARSVPATQPAAPRNEPLSRVVPAEHAPTVVDRSNHGSIRHVDTHVDTHVVEHPVVVRSDSDVHQHVIVHHDVDVDIHRQQFWHGFSFGAHHHALRAGYTQLFVFGVPYYYDNGIYYQQIGPDYQEVYPPIGANIGGLPDGAIEIVAGNVVYYYAGGAFYVQQGGVFVSVMPPMGVIVPELPPGVMQVSFNGGAVYQFNGVCYQPVFVNGVTCYMTFMR